MKNQFFAHFATFIHLRNGHQCACSTISTPQFDSSVRDSQLQCTLHRLIARTGYSNRPKLNCVYVMGLFFQSRFAKWIKQLQYSIASSSQQQRPQHSLVETQSHSHACHHGLFPSPSLSHPLYLAFIERESHTDSDGGWVYFIFFAMIFPPVWRHLFNVYIVVFFSATMCARSRAHTALERTHKHIYGTVFVCL